MNRPPHPWLPWTLAAAALVLTFLSVCIGPARLSPADLFLGDEVARTILWELRLPRALLGLLAGAVLGLAGAAMQGATRNPLADPGLLGVASGAAFGAVTVFYFGIAGVAVIALPLGGFAGAAAASVGLHLLAGRRAGVPTLLLAGVALNALFGALTALAMNLSPNPFAVMEITFWLLGSVADRTWQHIWLAAPPALVGMLLLLNLRGDVRALTLGEDTATTLGVDLRRMRWKLLAGSALAVGAVVSVAGAIGFVGLVVPHLLRRAAGQDPGRLLVLSALGGAVLLLAADIAVRVLPAQPELKLGVLTALVGAPFFAVVLARERRQLA